MTMRLILLIGLLIPSQVWAVAYNEVQTATDDGGATTLALAAQNLAAGSLNVACFKWETPSISISSITDTAGNTYTLLTNQTHSGGEPHARCGYVLSATGNASNVVTANFSGTAYYRRGAVYEFTYSGTASLDVQSGASAEDDADLTPTSAAVTTTGTEEVCVANISDFTGQTYSNHTINGIAADGATNFSDMSMWYEIFSSTFTSGAASLTKTATQRWVMRLQCFKITGGGGGGGTGASLLLMGVGR